ncbi:MAG TPA: hypothetical protein VLS89_10905, partial [Candidatus Nanopelagicales bacterium]|nr:hypothetical protein [Candidatus Nanopelagicales bacterium]
VQRAASTGEGSDRTDVFTEPGIALKEIAVANQILAATNGVMAYRRPLGSTAATTSMEWTPNQGFPVTGISVDAERIYFTGGVRIYWALHGDSASAVVEYEEPTIFDVASSPLNVYWTVNSNTDGLQVAWQPHTIDPDNGGLDVTGTPDRIAADDQHVCWT